MISADFSPPLASSALLFTSGIDSGVGELGACGMSGVDFGDADVEFAGRDNSSEDILSVLFVKIGPSTFFKLAG